MVKTNPLYTYETVVLDLSTARTGVEYSFSGNFIKVIEASDIDANIDVAFNSSGNDTVNLKKGRAIRANVLKWYLTNTAQAGKTVTLLIATEESLRIFDDGVVGDIDTIQEIIEPVAINHLPDKIISDQGLSYESDVVATTTNVAAAASSIYTVPANKIFYLAILTISEGSAAAGHSPRYWIYTDAAAVVLQYLGNAFSAVGGGETSFAPPLYYNPWLKMTAGEKIRLYNSGTCANSVIGHVFGYLKNA